MVVPRVTSFFCISSVPCSLPGRTEAMKACAAPGQRPSAAIYLCSHLSWRSSNPPIPSQHQGNKARYWLFWESVAMGMSDAPGCYRDTVAMVMRLLCLAEAVMEHQEGCLHWGGYTGEFTETSTLNTR